MNYYEILEVSKDASQSQIRDSYKKLIKKYHPDIYKGNKAFAENKTAKLNEAYSVLSNIDKKTEYDLELNGVPLSFEEATQKHSSDVYKKYQDAYNKATYKSTHYVSNEDIFEEESENWIQKFREFLYTYVDNHTQNLSNKNKLLILIIIVVISLFFTILAINDYIELAQHMAEQKDNTIVNEIENYIVYPIPDDFNTTI